MKGPLYSEELMLSDVENQKMPELKGPLTLTDANTLKWRWRWIADNIFNPLVKPPDASSRASALHPSTVISVILWPPLKFTGMGHNFPIVISIVHK